MIEAIKNGNAFAFEQAYQQSCEKVYSYFLKKTKSPEDAKDLLQITYLKLWQYRSSLSNDFLLDQQLFHIARTVFIDYLRKQNKQYKVEKAAQHANEISQPYAYTSTEFDIKAKLQTSLEAMPELRKKVFELSRLQGYSYGEIAGMLSISVKAVDNNLYKATRQLRKIFILIIFICIEIL